jgi:hypothetical protein
MGLLLTDDTSYSLVGEARPRYLTTNMSSQRYALQRCSSHMATSSNHIPIRQQFVDFHSLNIFATRIRSQASRIATRCTSRLRTQFERHEYQIIRMCSYLVVRSTKVTSGVAYHTIIPPTTASSIIAVRVPTSCVFANIATYASTDPRVIFLPYRFIR